jgi:hypothetical protein
LEDKAVSSTRKAWDILLRINKSFIKISLLKNSAPILHSLQSCGRNGHIADVCPMKKTFYKKNNKGSNPNVVNNWNTHKAWVPKQNKIIKANLHGPKKMWVPKRIT